MCSTAKWSIGTIILRAIAQHWKRNNTIAWRYTVHQINRQFLQHGKYYRCFDWKHISRVTEFDPLFLFKIINQWIQIFLINSIFLWRISNTGSLLNSSAINCFTFLLFADNWKCFSHSFWRHIYKHIFFYHIVTVNRKCIH